MARQQVVREYRSLDWKFWVLVTIMIAGSLFIAYQFGAFKKTCNDELCFKDALKNCDYAKFLTTKNFNYYTYAINGPTNGDCDLTIKLEKMAAGTPTEKITQFEGKSMRCRIPKSEIAKMEDLNFDKALNYCSGPLKEAMYELIIEKLYSVIIQNMGSIIGAVEDTLRGEV